MNQRPREASGKDSKIFVSYRRTDSPGHAGRLYADLKANFGNDRVFMDTAGIEGGEDFVRIIAERLAGSKVLIVVIGAQWLTLLLRPSAASAGATDWMRQEIVTAIEKHIPVIPVLVNNAEMPPAEEIPDELQALARVHAVTIRDDRWDLDVAYLNARLEEIVAPKSRRVAALLLALVSLALIGSGLYCYHLATVPWPAKPQADGKFNLPPALVTQQVVIEGPQVNTDTGLLLSHVAEPTDEILLEIDQARLSEETISELGLDSSVASAIGKLTYGPIAPEEIDASKRPCTTSIDVWLTEKKMPAEIHFSQPKSGGTDYRELEVKGAGADLLVSMNTNPESGADEEPAAGGSKVNGPGCGKQLLFGSDPQVDSPIYGPYTVEGRTTADSPVRFRFTPLPNSPFWAGKEGPFVFGSPKLKPEDSPPGLQARAVRIRSSTGDSVYEIRRVDETRLLRIEALAVDADRLRISVAGDAAFVTVNGEDGVGLRERVEEHPIKGSLLACTTVALLASFALFVRRVFSGRR